MIQQVKSKILILSVLAFLSSLSCKAQYISLENLIIMRNGDYDEINNILLPKGWIFQGKQNENNADECTTESIIWNYDATSSNKAHSFLVLRKSTMCSNSIDYQILNYSFYNRIRADIDKYKMRKVEFDSGVNPDNKPYVSTTFEGYKYRVVMVVYTSKEYDGTFKNSYNIYIYLK